MMTGSPRARAKRSSFLRMYLSDHNAYCEAPCTDACPTHVDVPGCLAALAEGDFAQAAAIVRKELPFPAILGYVCPAYCEPVCRRGDLDEPIAICATHRFIADESERRLQPGPSTGKRVAVVGAGFGGLSAAWFLVASGHRVTVYDSADTGGMSLRNEVAEAPLTDEAIELELRPRWDAGARFIGGRVPVRDLDLRILLDAGFDAAVRAFGPSGSQPLPVPDAGERRRTGPTPVKRLHRADPGGWHLCDAAAESDRLRHPSRGRRQASGGGR